MDFLNFTIFSYQHIPIEEVLNFLMVPIGFVPIQPDMEWLNKFDPFFPLWAANLDRIERACCEQVIPSVLSVHQIIRISSSALGQWRASHCPSALEEVLY